MAERNEILNRRAYADARHRYRLDERIATGGMGEVWRATDTVLDREVAVKLLKREYADDSVFRARLETEAQHAAGLRHPGVAQVFDFGSGDPNGDGLPPYLVMEYVDGRPLSALLRPGSPMQPAAAVSLLAAVGDALGAAHAQGIVHRDVKPANILVTDDRQVRITDFGIARAADDVSLTRTGEVVGTPQYISPEQAEGKPATPASDVYALGAVGFECLAGHRPFVAETPVATALAHLRDPVPDLPDTVPPALAAVIRRSLAKDPGDRYADGAAVASALRAADAGSPAPEAALAAAAASSQVLPAGADAGAEAEPVRRRRRIPAAVWAAGVLAVVLAVAALAAFATGGGGSPPPAGQTHQPTGTTGTVPSTPTSPVPSSPAGHQHKDDHGHQGDQGDQGGPADQGHGDHGNGEANGHEHGKGHQ